MQPQLVVLIICVAFSCVACQAPPLRQTYYNADGCNSTTSLVAEYQVAVTGDGCGDFSCEPIDNYWYSQSCSEALTITPGLSYVATYTGSDCSNETTLDERFFFAPAVTTLCLNISYSGVSFSINNTCTIDGQITINRYEGMGCVGNSNVVTGMDGMCHNSVYAYCVVGVPPQAPVAPMAPMAGPTATTAPQSTATPKSSTNAPKSSTANTIMVSVVGLIVSAIVL